jgi:hypothetical protein
MALMDRIKVIHGVCTGCNLPGLKSFYLQIEGSALAV